MDIILEMCRRDGCLQDIQECFNTTPPVHAEDEDRYLKSAINFELVEGKLVLKAEIHKSIYGFLLKGTVYV